MFCSLRLLQRVFVFPEWGLYVFEILGPGASIEGLSGFHYNTCCMYVCVYVCKYARMYVRMYVCMSLCLYVCMRVHTYVYTAGIPGVAVLVCARTKGARSDGMSTYPYTWPSKLRVGDVSRKSPPGQKFRHAAYNIDVCRGEAESPKTRFTWPAWRSNYFPGINLYYYIVSGGELCGVVLGVYGGKGVNMW